MALPVSIAGTLNASVRGRCGPFISSGGNVYVVLSDSADRSILEVWKATDPTSSFSEADAANHHDLTNVVIHCDVVQVSDVLHMAVVESSSGSGGRVSYHTFDMSTDLWALNEEVVATPANPSGRSGVGIAVRSDGDVIVGYNGTRDTVTMSDVARVKYARRESAVWTVNVALDNAGSVGWQMSSAVLGSSDRVHFLFIDGGSNDAYQRCLTSANALETFPATFDATTLTTDRGDIGAAVSYDSGGTIKVRVPYCDSTGTVSIAEFDSADAPTVSVTTGASATAPDASAGGGVATITTSQLACVAKETDVYLLFTDVTSLDLMRDVNTGSGWGTDATEFTGSVDAFSANVFVRSGNYKLAYVVNDSATMKYNELDLGSATPADGHPAMRRWNGVPCMVPGGLGSGRGW